MNAFCSGFYYLCSQKLETVCDSPEMALGVTTHQLGTAAVSVWALCTSDHCFINCELFVEQVIPEHNIRRVVHLKHRINWDNVQNAVRSLSCRTILRSADPIGALNRVQLVKLCLGLFLPPWCVADLETSTGLAATVIEHMMLRRLLTRHGIGSVVQICGISLCTLVLRHSGSMELQWHLIMSVPGGH